MVGTPGRIGVHPLAEDRHEQQLIADEAAWNVELLATHENDALSKHKFLCDDGGDAAHQVPPAVNDNGILEHHC